MQWLYERCQERPQARYIDDFTYREVDEAVRGLAKALLTLTEGSSRIALWAPNHVRTALCILAAMSIQCELVLLNIHLTEAEVEKQLQTLGVTHIVTDRVVTLAGYEVLSLEALEIYASKKGAASSAELAPYGYGQAPCADQIAVIMNTSATTGQFKSVPLRWRQLSAHVEASAKVLGVQEDDNWLLALPLFHISGLSILLRTLYNGTALTLLPHFEEEQFLTLVETGRINMVSLVPTIFSRVIDRLPVGRLRMVLLGGEFIPIPLVERCLAKKLPLFKTYGMTEATSQVTTVNVLAHPDKKTSVGKPLPGVTIHIVNPDTDGVGDIVITSPTLMEGYLGKAPIEGRLATGDIGYLDADGYLYILNRRQDLIISGGENIYPKEIEDFVYAQPGVRECAVVARADAKWGQVPILFVSGDCDVEALREALAGHFARYKIPQAVYALSALPKNASGKILRQQLLALVGEA